MNFVEIGQRIQYIRKNKLHLKRDEFAELLNSNSSSIGRIERGEVKSLDITMLDKIAKESGYSIDEIINGFLDNDKNAYIKRINYILNGLTEDELRYQFTRVHEFSKFIYTGNVRDIKAIKKDIKDN